MTAAAANGGLMMTCDHKMRSGGSCGRPMGHGGKHLSPDAIQNEAERLRLRRTTPGTCTRKDCDSPRHQWWTGSYDRRCEFHKSRDATAWRRKNPDKEYMRNQRQAARRRLKLLGEMGIDITEMTVITNHTTDKEHAL